MQSRFGVVLGVIAVVLVIVGFVGPWWTLEAHGSVLSITMSGNDQFGLFGGTAFSQVGSTSSSNTTSYSSLPHIGSVFTLALILVILGLIIGIGMIVVGAMSRAKPSFKRLGGLLGILAFVVLLVSTLYVMSALPDAVNQDSSAATSGTTVTGFWGTKTSTFGTLAQATVTWAAGWGWYVALIAAIIFLVAGVVLLMARNPAVTAAAPVPPPSP